MTKLEDSFARLLADERPAHHEDARPSAAHSRDTAGEHTPSRRRAPPRADRAHTPKADDRHLAALRAHWRRHKVFPPMSKLAQVLGLASASGVLKVLRRLTKAGYLEQIDGRVAPTPSFFARPVLSHDSVDRSMQAYRAGTGPTLNLEDYLLEHADRACYCVVRGNEMRDAGLLDGDVVVMEATRRPRPGDIVVARVDGRTSVRYLTPDDLDDEATEPAAGDIGLRRPPPFEVLGVVVGSFRRYPH